jgi:cystathionine gamma-synthase
MTRDPAAFETRAIHAGQEPDPVTGAVTVPIYQTSTYEQDGVGKHRGFEYSRTQNPTRQALETALADLEQARHGFSFASGMAAEDAILRTLTPGDRVLMADDAYGGTFRLISKVWSRVGITWTALPFHDLAALEAAWPNDVKLVWMESPTNPLLNVFDIEAISAIARTKGARVVVDNTFATPYLQQPMAMGADYVVHSTTKYLGGHSDVVGGFVGTNDDELASDLGFVQNSAGAVPAPMDCFLLLRGLKTLAVRMDRHCENAAVVADFLQSHPKVSRVLYPGLESHPGYEIAQRQMLAPGGIVSFQMADGVDAAKTVAESTELFILAESLGAVESLIEHPGVMTHASAAGSPLQVPDDLVRLSVGIEHIDDLLADLKQALG